MAKLVCESVEGVLKDLKKDREELILNKGVLAKKKDEGGDWVKICSVNGDFVRDKHPGLNFNQFVDGGHHYVTSYPGYKKHIPEDEIWVDDVFRLKPNDLHAIVKHEWVERNKEKYHHESYDKAHGEANKAESKFREKNKFN